MTSCDTQLVIPPELMCVPAVKKLMARLARGKPRVEPEVTKEKPECQPTTTAV